MSTMFAELFEGIDTYPGSKQKRADTKSHAPVEENANPFAEMQGRIEGYFTIGQLAAGLGREAGTIRKWEREGVIPAATYQINVNENKDQRARRRLYSRAQALGIWEIAREEGLLTGQRVYVNNTHFTQRVTKLFQSLKESR